ncbi:MAG: hypothetical protein LBQ75_08740 [Zoogloeaceae bacterium]|jgi:hypothetical protein|nr:hypothetical protein [Zoogloeaceae bacterium]
MVTRKKLLLIAALLFGSWFCATSAWGQAVDRAEMEQTVDIAQSDIQKMLDCAARYPNDGLDRYRSGILFLVPRDRRVYGLETRAIFWEKEAGRFVIQIAAPEPVARLYIPDAAFDFVPVAPALTEIRCRQAGICDNCGEGRKP